VTSDRIVVVGSLNVDLNVTVDRHPRPGETLAGRGGGTSPGGKGANQALAATRLGADVALVGAVGTDPAAETALSLLREAGTDLSAVRVVDGPTGLAIVVVDRAGENSIIVVEGANGTITAEAVEPHAELVASAAVVVVQGEIPPDGTATAARLCRGRLVLNLAPVVPIARDVLLRADPLVVNEHEGALVLEQLTGRTVSSSPRDVVEALSAEGIRSVVMTLGSEGALVLENGELVALPSARVDAVDSTGAGDAFVGALAARLATDATLRDAAALAVRVGAYAVRSAGAQPSYPRSGDALPEPSGPATVVAGGAR
jgi:ribokinase